MSVETVLTSINAIAALVQALFIVVSIIYINRQFGIVRACSYIERFNSHENICRRSKIDQWLKTYKDEQSRIKAFEGDADLQSNVLGFVNLFQELGVAYLCHSVHKRTVKETFDFLVPYYWNQLEFLIEYRRIERSHPTLFRKFEFMAKELSGLE